MLELLTGFGLSASAGLNAWVPLLVVGLVARYTELLRLPESWQWLDNGWVLSILAVLLVVELVADKIPVLDSVNDVLQTVVRPTSGGLVFAAGSSAETAAVSDPDALFADRGWLPVLVGVLVALVVHSLKSAARPVINAATAGVGGPVVSTAEDLTSLTMSVVAIVLPILILGFLAGLVGFGWWAVRRHRARRRARRAGQTSGPLPDPTRR